MLLHPYLQTIFLKSQNKKDIVDLESIQTFLPAETCSDMSIRKCQKDFRTTELPNGAIIMKHQHSHQHYFFLTSGSKAMDLPQIKIRGTNCASVSHVGVKTNALSEFNETMPTYFYLTGAKIISWLFHYINIIWPHLK